MIPLKRRRVARTPVHPGEILHDELIETGLSHKALARILKLSAKQFEEFLRGKSPLSTDMALRLVRYFRTSAELWMNLQKMYELDLARLTIGKALDRIPQRRKEHIF